MFGDGDDGDRPIAIADLAQLTEGGGDGGGIARPRRRLMVIIGENYIQAFPQSSMAMTFQKALTLGRFLAEAALRSWGPRCGGDAENAVFKDRGVNYIMVPVKGTLDEPLEPACTSLEIQIDLGTPEEPKKPTE
eukprot:9482745-Pyramimonas_sp.AAC.1